MTYDFPKKPPKKAGPNPLYAYRSGTSGEEIGVVRRISFVGSP
jgi:hypothetical protein